MFSFIVGRLIVWLIVYIISSLLLHFHLLLGGNLSLNFQILSQKLHCNSGPAYQNTWRKLLHRSSSNYYRRGEAIAAPLLPGDDLITCWEYPRNLLSLLFTSIYLCFILMLVFLHFHTLLLISAYWKHAFIEVTLQMRLLGSIPYYAKVGLINFIFLNYTLHLFSVFLTTFSVFFDNKKPFFFSFPSIFSSLLFVWHA